jgi:hypothetical protein
MSDLGVIIDPRPLSNSAPHPHLLPFLSSKAPPPLIEDPPGFNRQSVLDPSFRFAPVFDKTAQGERDVVTLKMGAPRGVSDVVSSSKAQQYAIVFVKTISCAVSKRSEES